MRSDVEVRLGPGDRKRLEAVLAIGTAPRSMSGGHGSSSPRPKAAARWRSCAGPACPSPASGAGSGASWRRASTACCADKTRKPGRAPVAVPVAARLIERTLGEPPGETTHWTSRAMAKVAGLAISTVQKIWRAHGLAPHRLRTFKLSRDPQFASKIRDVVGLYVDPPAHAVVLSVDEKSQIQALDRTQSSLPMKKGRA